MRTSYTPSGSELPVAVGQIDSLQGCSQVAVFHSAFVLPQFRNQGIGNEAHVERLRTAEGLLYDYAIVTIDHDNRAQREILINNNWGMLASFFSNKTGHTVEIWGRHI